MGQKIAKNWNRSTHQGAVAWVPFLHLSYLSVIVVLFLDLSFSAPWPPRIGNTPSYLRQVNVQGQIWAGSQTAGQAATPLTAATKSIMHLVRITNLQ